MITLQLDQIIDLALREDIGDGDITSLSCIPSNAEGSAQLLVKEAGIIAGVEVARKVFQKINPNIHFTKLIDDKSPVKPGDVVFEVKGHCISILTAERLALNFMQRMSGIATKTNDMVQLIAGTSCKLLDTRKTTPNFRLLEKMAVEMGGGVNHRFGLFDMYLIKDNHIDFAGGITKAIEAVETYKNRSGKYCPVEVEVRDMHELHEVLSVGKIDRIMLDNFSVEEMHKAVALINKKYETEASGGITEQTIRAYAETGVDYISVGALTHHIKSLDLSLITK